MEQYTPGVFGRLARAVMRSPRRSFVWVVSVCVLAFGLSLYLEVDPNILSLLPPEDPTTQAIQKINDEEGGSKDGVELSGREALLFHPLFAHDEPAESAHHAE